MLAEQTRQTINLADASDAVIKVTGEKECQNEHKDSKLSKFTYFNKFMHVHDTEFKVCDSSINNGQANIAYNKISYPSVNKVNIVASHTGIKACDGSVSSV